MQHIILLASLSGELLCRLGSRIWSQAKGLFTASLHNKRDWDRGKELERWKRHGDMASEAEMDKSAMDLKTLIESGRDIYRWERKEKQEAFYHHSATIFAFSPWSFCIRINSLVFQGLSVPNLQIYRSLIVLFCIHFFHPWSVKFCI